MSRIRSWLAGPPKPKVQRVGPTRTRPLGARELHELVDCCLGCAAPWVLFVRYRAHAEALHRALKHVVPVAVVHGGVELAERQGIQQSLKSGQLLGVAATRAWATGVDVPQLRTVINAAGGCAPITLRQQAGRGTRKAEGKGAFTVVDFALGNVSNQQLRLRHYERGGLQVKRKNT